MEKESGDFRNTPPGRQSGALRSHRLLVDFRLDLLAEETSAPGPRDETRLDFSQRIVAASRGLLLRLGFSPAAETFLAG